jgi:hypothetical protein
MSLFDTSKKEITKQEDLSDGAIQAEFIAKYGDELQPAKTSKQFYSEVSILVSETTLHQLAMVHFIGVHLIEQWDRVLVVSDLPTRSQIQPTINHLKTDMENYEKILDKKYGEGQFEKEAKPVLTVSMNGLIIVATNLCAFAGVK